jgi:hypothetical protein
VKKRTTDWETKKKKLLVFSYLVLLCWVSTCWCCQGRKKSRLSLTNRDADQERTSICVLCGQRWNHEEEEEEGDRRDPSVKLVTWSTFLAALRVDHYCNKIYLMGLLCLFNLEVTNVHKEIGIYIYIYKAITHSNSIYSLHWIYWIILLCNK